MSSSKISNMLLLGYVEIAAAAASLRIRKKSIRHFIDCNILDAVDVDTTTFICLDSINKLESTLQMLEAAGQIRRPQVKNAESA